MSRQNVISPFPNSRRVATSGFVNTDVLSIVWHFGLEPKMLEVALDTTCGTGLSVIRLNDGHIDIDQTILLKGAATRGQSGLTR